MSADKRLKENNIVLPEAPAPVGSYVASKIVGKLLYISGQISMNSKGELIKGKLGKDLNTEDGYKAAERCALSILAQAKKILSGDLDKIKSCVKIVGFVNSTNDFIEQPKVINGVSDMLVKILEDKGMHTRAVSYTHLTLPTNSWV